MQLFKTIGLLLTASGAVLAATATAQVTVISRGTPIIASYHSRGMCLDVRASDKNVLLWTCHGGANQAFRFRTGDYGQISLGDNMCLTGGASQGSPLTSQPCSYPNRFQMWGFKSNGTLRNEAGWCADVHSGRRDAGAPIINWNCTAASNQRWYPAVSVPSVTLGIAGLSAVSRKTAANEPVQAIISSGSFSSGNLVAAGGGNLVAAGGGNLVAAGGGNLVAAGGGNVVPTNAGNLLPRNFNFFNNMNAGQLVGNDGAS